MLDPSPIAFLDRQRRRLAWGYVIVLVAIVLAPYRLERPSHVVQNRVERTGSPAGLRFARYGIARSNEPAVSLDEALRRTGEMSVRLRLASDDLDQGGPARIVTHSLDPALRNFTVGQDRDALVFRLRTDQTDLNGVRPQTRVEEVFRSHEPIEVLVSYDDGGPAIWVDGELRAEPGRPRGDFSNWSRFRLALGNELTGNRPWTGRLFLVAIYDRALTPALLGDRAVEPVVLYTFEDEAGGTVRDRSGRTPAIDLALPETLTIREKSFFRPPYRYIDPEFLDRKRLLDIGINVVLFVPLGFLFFGLMRDRRHGAPSSALIVLALAILLSAAIETVQYYIPTRESTLGDVLHNGLGTALGIGLAWWRQGSREGGARNTS